MLELIVLSTAGSAEPRASVGSTLSSTSANSNTVPSSADQPSPWTVMVLSGGPASGSSVTCGTNSGNGSTVSTGRSPRMPSGSSSQYWQANKVWLPGASFGMGTSSRAKLPFSSTGTVSQATSSVTLWSGRKIWTGPSGRAPTGTGDHDGITDVPAGRLEGDLPDRSSHRRQGNGQPRCDGGEDDATPSGMSAEAHCRLPPSGTAGRSLPVRTRRPAGVRRYQEPCTCLRRRPDGQRRVRRLRLARLLGPGEGDPDVRDGEHEQRPVGGHRGSTPCGGSPSPGRGGTSPMANFTAILVWSAR